MDLPDRASPQWEHLRNLDTLKSLIGTVIELPVFPNMPKEFDASIAQRVLLSPERLELIKELFETLHLGHVDVANKSQHSGMILSGSNGVGKTVDSYLLMSILYVNNALVIYIVRSIARDSFPAKLTVFNSPNVRSGLISRCIQSNIS